MMQSGRLTSAQLRRDLIERAAAYARTNRLLHDVGAGPEQGVVFGREELEGSAARHGNFHPASYAAICARPDWMRRLAKPHTASRRSRARKDWRWMELDSALSSDALLMNIFCHPGVFSGSRLAEPVAALLNVDAAAEPIFGVCPGVPLLAALGKAAARRRLKTGDPAEAAQRTDRTEIDLKLAGPSATLFVEAKLTESGFQNAAPSLLARYRDLESVFEVERLPVKAIALPPLPANVDPDDPTVNLPARVARTRIAGYQLIRNVLAAYAADASFCVLCDARRSDLIESWFSVLSAVRSLTFATRLRLLTWQELAAVLPCDLQSFLAEKYGIEPC